MIPRRIHRIWLGGPMPPEVAEYGQRWKELHPGWQVRTWRDWDLPALRHQVCFDLATTPAASADIARLELLQRFGGLYVDTDAEPLRPFDPLLEESTCFLGREDDRWIATGVIGATPHHPFVNRLLDRLGRSVLSNPGAPPNEVSGPKFVTAVYAELPVSERAHVTVYPPAYFYPYHFSEPDRASGPFPDAYAVHHWSHSWVE